MSTGAVEADRTVPTLENRMLKQFARTDLLRLTSSSVLLILSLLGLLGISATGQVSSNSFGLSMHAGIIARQPWPSVSFGTMRLWDAEVSWAQINGSKGYYKWASLDAWLNEAATHNKTVIYSFGRVPRWASSAPNDNTCSYGPGQCDPPNDLNADGTGTNQHWKDFVSAIATHAAGRINIWELWNEAPNAWYWTGTNKQLLRMAADARTIVKGIDPNAVILTPSAGIRGKAYRDWMANYLAQGGGAYADGIAFHGYIQVGGVYPIAEDFYTYFRMLKQTLATYGQSNKPLYDTEFSWGRASRTGFYDQNLQAGFTTRGLLLHASEGVARTVWYMWNSTDVTGTLWAPNPTDSSASGTLLKPGIAFREVQKWLTNSKFTQRCAGSNSTWSCTLVRQDSSQIEAVWYTAGSKTYIAASMYHHYRDVYGNTYSIPPSGAVTIGYRPILLEP